MIVAFYNTNWIQKLAEYRVKMHKKNNSYEKTGNDPMHFYYFWFVFLCCKILKWWKKRQAFEPFFLVFFFWGCSFVYSFRFQGFYIYCFMWYMNIIIWSWLKREYYLIYIFLFYSSSNKITINTSQLLTSSQH